MLILTRKTGEGLYLGDHIRITVVEIRGKQIRLGIEAPEHVVVLREEIFHRLREQNRQAAGVVPLDLHEISRLWKQDKEHESQSANPTT